jgi:hypothetical protein
MPESIATNAGELLLSSMYMTRGEDGLVNKFLFGPPGAPSFASSLGTQVFFRRRQLVRAALFVRQSGPAYLKAMSVSDIQSMLRKFVVENYGLVAGETFLQQFDVSYHEHLSEPTRTQFVRALSASHIFQPHDDLSLYPLVPVNVEEDFWSPSFFLIQPSSLANESIISDIGSSVHPEEFPPPALGLASSWRHGEPNGQGSLPCSGSRTTAARSPSGRRQAAPPSRPCSQRLANQRARCVANFLIFAPT